MTKPAIQPFGNTVTLLQPNPHARVSPDPVWPLRDATGQTWAQRKAMGE